MRLVHLLTAAAILAVPFALTNVASAGPAKDLKVTKDWTSPYKPKVITKVGPFDCGKRPCDYKVETKIPKKPGDPGPLRVPGKVGPSGL